ncbi:MAG: hypothetical protein IH918_00385 [Acidobacteria bacterium]|nr:hypothetical protein [Acidobacteriota bacterium]
MATTVTGSTFGVFGQSDSTTGTGPALWRVIHDNDRVDEEFPDTVEEPLTP